MNIYYVYQYLREDGTPYYIGKGSKNRAYSTCRTIPRPKDRSKIQILAHSLSEPEALLLETKLIAFFGRVDTGTGILHNKTDGGEGSPNVVNKKAWNKGKCQSKEHNLKISKALKNYTRTKEHQTNINKSLKGRDPTFLGKSHSAETKEKLRQINLGKTRGPTPESVKEKIRASLAETRAKKKALFSQG